MERMEKQTAVEWLENRFLQTEGNLYAEDFTKAREMEKEQICNAYTMGVSPMLSIWRFGEDYYKETFKSE